MKGNLFPVSGNEQAYWLGFITADGHVSKSGKFVSIQLSSKDKTLLEEYSLFTGAKLTHGETYDKRTEKTYYWSRAIIHSVDLNKSLKGVGLGSSKTLELDGTVLDNIPEDMLGSFFRGFFDGDGYIGNISGNEFRLTLVGTKEFLTYLDEKVSSLAKVAKGPLYKSGSIWHLSYTGAERIRTIREWMRSDGPWLERKKVVWESVQQNGTSRHQYIYLMKDGRWWARWRNPETKKYFSFGKYKTEEEAYVAQQAGIAEFSRGSF